MNTLQELLVILDGQKLGPGYLTPKPTALETVIDLKKQYDPWVLVQNPLPYPQLLMTPAWVGSLGVGQDAIFMEGVNGALDFSHTPKPAYVFA